MCGRARLTIAGLSLVAGLLVAQPCAMAEAPPLRSIPPDAFEDKPAGLRLGGLVYSANVSTGAIYDSNVYSSNTDVAADRILLLRPELSISNLDPNHRFTFRAMIEDLEYERLKSENRTDARAEIDGKIRIRRDLGLDVRASAARLNEVRSLTNRDLPTNAAGPARYDQYIGSMSLVRTADPMVATTTVGVQKDDYSSVESTSGTLINLQYLDRDMLRVGQEEDIRLSHRVRLFGAQTMTASNYRNVPGYQQRDSVKFDVLSGVEIGITPLIKTKFTFRFGEEHFKDPTIDSEPELDYGAEISWLPRRYLRVRAGVAREFGGVNFDLDSEGGIRTRVDVGIDYEMSRRLLARAGFYYLHADETSISTGETRIEDTYVYRASLAYQMNRYWSAFADYAFEKRESDDVVDTFQRQIVQAGVTAKF